MSSPQNTQLGPNQGAWMYSDPYTYQYTTVEQDTPGSPYSQDSAAGSTIANRTGESRPADEPRGEFPAANRLSAHEADRDSDKIAIDDNSCGLSRNRHSIRHDNRRHHKRRQSPRAGQSANDAAASGLIPVPVPADCPMIPVPQESYLIPVPDESDLIPVENYVPSPYYRGRSPCEDGLMLVGERDASTPKGPTHDFDEILKNIEPVSKDIKRKVWQTRSGRYYDRYSSNFG